MRAAALVLLLSAPAGAADAPRLDSSNKGLIDVCSRFQQPLVWHRRAPDCAGWGVRAGRRVLMSYNGLGLRDKDYPPRPAPGVLRVLVAGGSITIGSGLEEAESPPRAFERALRRRGLRAEVIDAAGEGYITWQNEVLLEGLLKAYSPRAVVYHLPSQHIFTDVATRPLLRVERGRALGLRPPPFPLKQLGLRAPTRLLFIYQEQWQRIAASRRLSRLPPEALAEALLEPTLEDLKAMRDVAAARGASFHVVYAAEEANADYYVLPGHPFWLAGLAQKLLISPFRVDGAVILARLRAAGLDVLDLSAERAALEAPAHRIAGDYHWNAAGAELFGEAAAREFSKRQRRETSRTTPATAAAAPSAARALTRSP